MKWKKITYPFNNWRTCFGSRYCFTYLWQNKPALVGISICGGSTEVPATDTSVPMSNICSEKLMAGTTDHSSLVLLHQRTDPYSVRRWYLSKVAVPDFDRHWFNSTYKKFHSLFSMFIVYCNILAIEATVCCPWWIHDDMSTKFEAILTMSTNVLVRCWSISVSLNFWYPIGPIFSKDHAEFLCHF